MTVPVLQVTPMQLLARVEQLRGATNAQLSRVTQAELGQFTTPLAVATFMAECFPTPLGDVRLLDAGAGVGSLTAAAVAHLISLPQPPSRIDCTAFELDGVMAAGLTQTLDWLRELAGGHGVDLHATLRHQDFLQAVDLTGDDTLFAGEAPSFTHAILNPPYRKLTSRRAEKAQLAARGLDHTNLYTAFLDLAMRLLVPGGELVAITPRSFFNGAYYRDFRQRFLSEMTLQRVHLIESRKDAFKDNDVLQETVIFHATKGASKAETVRVSYSMGFSEAEHPEIREVLYASVVHPNDPEAFIRVDLDDHTASITDQVSALPATLADLGLKASTGKVVDFRALDFIRTSEAGEGQPLIYPGHLRDGQVQWPQPLIGKPNVVHDVQGARKLLVPEGYYVLVKRFSAKEETRRVSASIYEPERVKSGPVGFENHLNYIHEGGQGLPRELALGLCAFLNSTVFDVAFRQFSGHTQVNVTDLKSMRFPTRETLVRLGQHVTLPLPEQSRLDTLVQAEVFGMAEPSGVTHRVEEAQAFLNAFELPRSARNERSALTLLALLDLRPDEPWSEAKQPLRGVTPIMSYCRDIYGKGYAPNSRESFRKDTLHHWVDEAIVELNPDDPQRATNSQKTVYRVHDDFLALARLYGTDAFEAALAAYQGATPARKRAQADVHAENLITVKYGEDEFTLSPGGQNPLVKRILDDFCPRYAPGAEIIYVGDTADKSATRYGLFRKERLQALGITLEEHGLMPDLIVYRADKNWLYLIEAVSSHGPFDQRRLGRMQTAFKDSTAGIVYVTAFKDRADFQARASVIAWETEVWVADDPQHLIHYNGDRFFGPR